MSPRLKARIAGAIYLICGMAYSFARNDVRGTLVVEGDAAATAHNILAHELPDFSFTAARTDLFPYVVAPAGTLGELSLVLWLLVIGVNTQRWREQAGAAGERQ